MTNKQLILDVTKVSACISALKGLTVIPAVNSEGIKNVDSPLSVTDKLFNYAKLDKVQKTAAESLVWAQETTRYWIVKAYLLGGTDYVLPTELKQSLSKWNINLPIDPEKGFKGLVYAAKNFGKCAAR